MARYDTNNIRMRSRVVIRESSVLACVPIAGIESLLSPRATFQRASAAVSSLIMMHAHPRGEFLRYRIIFGRCAEVRGRLES
jgi:hypothetical protein